MITAALIGAVTCAITMMEENAKRDRERREMAGSMQCKKMQRDKL